MLTWCKSVFNARAMPLILAALALMEASPSYADGQLPLPFGGLESIIDFEKIVKHLMPIIETAVEAAAGVGAVVLAALACWRFFKSFIRG